MQTNIKPLRQIGTIYRASNSFTDFVAKHHNLEKSQYQFLVRIGENPGITQQELSTILQVDKGTVLKAVKKLMNKKLVTRDKHPQDKRKYLLYLTEPGQEAFIFIMKEELFVVDLCLKGLSVQQQKQLQNLLATINKNIESLWIDVRQNKLDHYLALINDINYPTHE